MTKGRFVPEVNERMHAIGQRTLGEVAAVNAEFRLPAPGRERAMAVEAGVQAVINAHIAGPGGPEPGRASPPDVAAEAVEALAHVIAIIMAQQEDPRRAIFQFADMIMSGVSEIRSDAADTRTPGTAHLLRPR